MPRRSKALLGLAAVAGAVSLVSGCGEDEVVRRAAAVPVCEECPALGHGLAPPATLECLQVPRRLVPDGSEAAAWALGVRRFAVVWRSPASGSGFAVWSRTRAGSWDRLVERRRETAMLNYSVSVDDVTGDGRLDALANESEGSGGCGAREAFRVEADRATRLFRRSACELDSDLRDGLMWFREPIGECTDRGGSVHCHGGVRITMRGWSGDRLVADRVIVRCLRQRLDPARGCRR
jgi:hypothetical protein